MKYKDIKPMAHNFSHSFLSYENYVDGDYVVEDIKKLVRVSENGKVSICWIPQTSPTPHQATSRLLKAIGLYQRWLPKHVESHGIDIACILEFRIEIARLPSHQLTAQAFVRDNRGKVHISEVEIA